MNSTRYRKILFLTLLYFLLGGSSLAQQLDRSAAIAKAQTRIEKYMQQKQPPGFSFAVAKNGTFLWAEGFGLADIENRVAVTPATKFRVGSVSKPMTAAALGILIEQGKLDINAPVQTYVKSFPKKRWPISTRQIAGHIAGIRHYKNDEFLMAKSWPNVTESLSIFDQDPLLFEPGTKYSYSSYGWNLVSAVIEGASGQEFLAFMQAHVFDPLGMTDTAPDLNDSLISFRTRFYHRSSNGTLKNAPYVDNSYKWAGGGFLATPKDMVIFGEAHAKPGFLKKKTLALLITSLTLNDGSKTNYGLGWRSGKTPSGASWYGHSGGSVGGTAYLIIFPEQGIVAAMLANIGNAGFGTLPMELAACFFE